MIYKTKDKMAFIAFLGCDGSGKSAVIERVTSILEADGNEVWKGHWRPQPFSNNTTDNHISTADDPHGQTPRGKLSSILKLAWLWLNWWVGWFGGLRAKSRQGMVIYDRYHGDIRVDPRRYRYGGPSFLAEWASNMMPQPDIVFFLDAVPEVLLSRKQEVPRAALEKARRAYLQLVDTHTRFATIDASPALEAVVHDVLRIIDERSG